MGRKCKHPTRPCPVCGLRETKYSMCIVCARSRQGGSNNHNWRGGRSKTPAVYRKTARERDPMFLLKKRVREAVRRAVNSGKLERPVCPRCGKPMEYHHPEYLDTNPFNGWFACKAEHRYDVHSGMKWNQGKKFPRADRR